MAFAGHVLQGSGGDSALQILEGRIEGTVAQGRPRRMWLDDIKSFCELSTYETIKRTENRKEWKACIWKACQPSEVADDS